MKGKLLLLVLAFNIFIGVESAFLPVGCAPGQDVERAQDEIEDVLDDFYEAFADGDRDDLEELATEDLREKIETLADDETLEILFEFHRDFEYDIDEIEVDEDEAEALVEFVNQGTRFEQEVELEFEDGEWLVSDFSEPAIVGTVNADEETAGLSREEKVERTLEQVFSAFKSLDAEQMSRVATGDIRADFLPGFFTAIHEMRSDPERERAERARWGGLSWHPQELRFDRSGDKAIAVVQLDLAGQVQIWEMDFRLEDDKWLWSAVRLLRGAE